jgi:hypothetical protein
MYTSAGSFDLRCSEVGKEGEMWTTDLVTENQLPSQDVFLDIFNEMHH